MSALENEPVHTLGTVSGWALQFPRDDSDHGWARVVEPQEGVYLESFERGAFDQTIATRGSRIRLLMAHGRDPRFGDLPLGPLSLSSDHRGLGYSAPLLDTELARSIEPALRSGLLGASIRFSPLKDRWTQRPKRSARNPEGLPERVVTRAALHELSLCTFPAYSSSSATMRGVVFVDGDPYDQTDHVPHEVATSSADIRVTSSLIWTPNTEGVATHD